jgi:hypothetical protein
LSITLLLLIGFPGNIRAAKDTDSNQIKKWNYKGEIFGALGIGAFYHGDDGLGKGLQAEVGFGVRPFKGTFNGLGFEMKFIHQDFERQTSPNHFSDGNFNAFLGSAVYHFGGSKTQPYVAGGIGFLKADYTYRYLSEWYDGNGDFYQEHKVEVSKDSKMAIRIAGGIKFAVTNQFSIRPELQILDTTIGEGYNWSQIGLSVAAGFHF